MKKNLLVTLSLSTLLFSACGNANSVQHSNENQSNVNTSVKTKSEVKTVERHIKIKSENNFDETYAALKKAIESKKPLSIIAELDHSANAKTVG